MVGSHLRLPRVVPGAVRAERDDPRVVLEDLGGAVALVDVQVDHEDRVRAALEPRGVLAKRHRRRDGDVVEDAEALAFVPERVVCAARDLRGALGGGARAEDVVRGGDGPARGRQGARHLRGIHHRKSDGAAFLFRERAPQDAGHVSLLVHGEHVDERCFLRVFRFWTAR